MENLVPNTPLFHLTVEQAESLFKSWIAETIKATEPATDPEPVFYTRHDARRILHLSLPTVDLYIKKGILEAKKCGNRYLIPKDSIEKALKNPPKYRRA